MPLKKIGELIIPSSLDHLDEVDRFAESMVKVLALPKGMLDDVAISATEAVNNAILHGNKQDAHKKVTIKFYLCTRYLRLVVQDEGGGFAPDHVPDPRQRQNLLKTTGRGLLIMRHLMDRVTFQRSRHGMSIIMDKYCPGTNGIPCGGGGHV
jgi:serine/threonine-protein kinase RsbW